MSYRLLYCSLVGLAFALMLGWFWFCFYLIPTAPHSPDSLHTIPWQNHGVTAYLTPLERKSGPGFLIGAAFVALAGETVRRRANFNFRREELG